MKLIRSILSRYSVCFMVTGILIFTFAAGLIVREISIGTVERAELASRNEQAQKRAVAQCETQNEMKAIIAIVVEMLAEDGKEVDRNRIERLRQALVPVDCSLEGDFVQRRLQMENRLLDSWRSERRPQEEEATDTPSESPRRQSSFQNYEDQPDGSPGSSPSPSPSPGSEPDQEDPEEPDEEEEESLLDIIEDIIDDLFDL